MKYIKLVGVAVVAFSVGSASFLLTTAVMIASEQKWELDWQLFDLQALRDVWQLLQVAGAGYLAVALPCYLACLSVMALVRRYIVRANTCAPLKLYILLGVFGGLLATIVFAWMLQYYIGGRVPTLGHVLFYKEDLAWLFSFHGPSALTFFMGWWWVFSRVVSHRVSNTNSTPTSPSG